jgi:enterochelin esterase-like enzyme
MRFLSLIIALTLLVTQAQVGYLSGVSPMTPEFHPVNTEEQPQAISFGSTSPGDCQQRTGTVLDTSLDSKIYQAPVKFSLYLPPCFSEKDTTRYPVLYLLHGQTYDNHQWIRLGLAEAADVLINGHQIAPLIIVMPNDPDWRQPNDSLFGRMLVSEMLPYVDQTYPTLSERQYRVIGGLSRGASWALHLGLTNWQLFSRIGAHSLPVFANDSAYIPKWLTEIPDGSHPQIYIDTGNQDPELNIARNVEALLTAHLIPHEWHMFTGEHDESYWSHHLQKYLLWYACEWAFL